MGQSINICSLDIVLVDIILKSYRPRYISLDMIRSIRHWEHGRVRETLREGLQDMLI